MTKARDLANASTALSAVSATELAFVDGVTSAIQTQLDAKATLTGTETFTNKTLTSPVLTTPTISTVNAKGDLLVGTADNTIDRLAVGSNGETLVADSAATTGLRYQPTTAAGKNGVINGGVDLWQRGTTFTGSNTYIYTADRWAWRDTSGGLASLLQVTSSLPDGFRYGLKYGRVNASTMTNAQYLQLPLETSNSIPFANQTVTMSFYAKKGANFSGTGLGVTLYSGTGTDQTVGGTTGGAASWTGSSAIISQTITSATLTTSWVRYSYSVAVGSTATQLAATFQITPVGTAGADDYLYFTGVQLEIGAVATQFTRTGGSIQGELAACQRYYEQVDYSSGQFGAGGYCQSATVVWWNWPIVVKRTTPTVGYNAALRMITGGGTGTAITSISGVKYGNGSAVSWYFGCASGPTAGQSAGLEANGSTATITFSAEL